MDRQRLCRPGWWAGMCLVGGMGGSGCGPDLGEPLAVMEKAPATDLVVNTLADENDGYKVGNKSLREAITQANLTLEPDTIMIQIGGVINITSPLPDISANLTIQPVSDTLAITVQRNGTADYRIFNVAQGITATFSKLTLKNGRASQGGAIQGGASSTITLNSCVLSNNTATSFGGAISSTGVVQLNGSSLNQNAAYYGSAVSSSSAVFVNDSSISENVGTLGGAFYVQAGSLTVNRSLFRANADTNGVGAIYQLGGETTVYNSTFSTNSGGRAASLGVDAGKVNLYGTTFVGVKGVATPQIDVAGNGVVKMGSTALSGVGCRVSNTAAKVESQGWNVVSDGSCSLNQSGDKPNTDPGLMALGNTGGLTSSHMPGPCSPVLNASGSLNLGSQDQRGATRNQGGAIDVGAVESAELPCLSVKPMAQAEGSSTSPTSFPVKIELSSSTVLAVSGSASTKDDTAGSPSDYTATSSSFSIAAGATSATFAVPVVGDTTYEANEVFNVSVAGVTNATIVDSFAPITVVNDDAASPTMSTLPDVVTAEDTPYVLSFTVADEDTPSSNLVVTASSSNTTLFPVGSLIPGGSGSARTLTLSPALNQNGTATVTVTVSDGTRTSSDSFGITVNSVNDAPTLTDILDTTTPEDTPRTGISFVVGDVETPHGSLVVTATSSDQGIVADSGILLDNYTTATRTMSVTPQANVSGSTTLTVRVSDGKISTSDSFVLTVTAVNDPPKLSVIPDQSTDEDKPITVNFALTDIDTPSTGLTVTGNSSDTTLLPNSNISFSSGSNGRSITLNPVANLSGTTYVSVVASDGQNTVGDTFALTVNPVNDAPTITSIADQTTPEDTPRSGISFTVGDLETSANQLTVSAKSSNTTLLPDGNITISTTSQSGGRALSLTPLDQMAGTTVVTVSVSDGKITTNTSFTLTVTAVDDPPVLTALPDLSVDEDKSISTGVSFSDPDTNTSDLTARATSSNTTLLPSSGITLANLGSTWTLTLTPAPEASGTAQVTVTVSDASQSISDTLTLTVNPVNDPPSITVASLLNLTEDTSGVLSFALQDVDSDVSTLTLSASATPAILLPTSGLVLGGTGASRTLTVTPGLNQNGNGQITLSTSDGVNTVNRNVSVSVSPVNDAPTLSDIPNQASTPSVSVSNIPFTVGDLETTVGSLTLAATSSNTLVVPKSGIVFGGSGANRTVSVTPGVTIGQSTITITVSDGTASTSDTFVFTVAAAVAPPTITSFVDQSMPEDGTINGITFTIGDPDTTLSSLVVTATSSDTSVVAGSGLTIGGSGKDRTLSVVPVPHGNGSTTITVSVSDGTSTSQSSFKVVVTAVNDAPSISSVGDQTTLEDTPVTGLQVTLSDVDNDVGSFGVSVSSSNTSLIPTTAVVVSGSGATRGISLTPSANGTGSATITLTVTDGSLGHSTTFKVTVTAVNDPPTITTITNAEVDEDESISLNFTISDVESAANSLVLSLISSNTSLISSSSSSFGGSGKNRTLTLNPVADQSGSTSIEVGVSDGTITTTTTFTLLVHPVNDAPTVSEIADISLNEDQSVANIPFTVGDLETPADELSVSVAADGSALLPSGSVVVGGQGATRTLSITPTPNISGSAVIVLSVGDGGLTTLQEIGVTVSGRNDAPILSGVTDLTTKEDEALSGITLVVEDPDTSLAQLTLSANSSDVTLLPLDNIRIEGSGATRILTLTPAPDQHGEVEVTLTLSDGDLSVSGALTLVVTSVNDAPTLSEIPNQLLQEDTSRRLDFTVGDVDHPLSDLEVSVTSDSELFPSDHLVLEGAGTSRSLTLIPAADSSGSASLVLTVSDGTSTTARSFVVTVQAVDDAPQIVGPVEMDIEEDSDLTSLEFVVRDAETPASQLVMQAFSLNEEVVASVDIQVGGSGENRLLSFLPQPHAWGDVYVVLLVDDGEESSSHDLLIHVASVEDDPLSQDDLYEVEEDSSLEVSTREGVGANDEDVDGDSLLFGLLQQPLSGELEFGPDGSFIYLPQPNFAGMDQFSYVVIDETGRESTSDVWIDVVAVNDAPVAEDDLYGTVVGRTLVVYPGQGVLANDMDVDGDTLAVAIESGPAYGEVVLIAGGGFEWTPQADFVGEDSFTYAVVDPGGLTARAKVTLVAAEGDRDGDGIPDEIDICPDIPDPEQIDQDGDGIGDVCDACPGDITDDGDDDGICGEVDNCPDVANDDQQDTDQDGQGDECDTCPGDPNNDVDRDGVCGDVDVCPETPDPDQLDWDEDGIGNSCDDETVTDPPTTTPETTPTPANSPTPEEETEEPTEKPTEVPTEVPTELPTEVPTVLPTEEPPVETASPRPDLDQDEIPDGDDNCPEIPNSDQGDVDDDGVGDVCEDETPTTPQGTPEEDNDDRSCGCRNTDLPTALGQLLLLLPVIWSRRRRDPGPRPQPPHSGIS